MSFHFFLKKGILIRKEYGNEEVIGFMGNIIDYISEHGKYTFRHRPLNEVDSLVLCQLVYLNYGPFVKGLMEDGGPVDIQTIYSHPERDRILDDYWYRENNKELFAAAAQSVRFGSLRMNYYENVIHKEGETQFCAMTYLLEDGSCYVAYRGTDATIVGWKEDLNLAFSEPLNSQYLSVRYLDKVAGLVKGDLYVGGHSKGGNLAVYAAMNCSEETRERLLHIYNNDGPGFRPEIRRMGNYEAVADRISKYIPRSSVVGMILEDHSDYEVVESRGVGLLQHNTYSWKIEGTSFVRAKNMRSGKLIMDRAMNEWILSLSQEETHAFVDTLYEVVSASEASNVFEFGADLKKSMQSIFGAAKNVDEDTRKAIQKIIHSLFEILAENIGQNILEKF